MPVRPALLSPSLRVRGRLAWALALVTVAYNFAEGVIALWIGHGADSWGVVSFGVDAVAESLSGMVVLWRFAPAVSAWESARYEQREQRAVLLIGISFLIVAAAIAFEAVQRLLTGRHGHAHELAFVVAAVSLVVKPSLFWFKWRLGHELHSPALRADAKQTLACAALSATLLLGLLAQRLFGLWQADALLALIIAAVLVREGVHTLRHRHLLCC